MSENLDSLVAEAAALESEAAPSPAAADAAAAEGHDLPAEVAALLKTTAAMLAPMFPSLAEVYTDATCQQLGTAAAPVMEKYGLSVGGIFDRWGAEITLAATALPVAVATYQGVKADLSARKKPAVPAAAPYNEQNSTSGSSAQAMPGGAGAAASNPSVATAGMLVIPAPSE